MSRAGLTAALLLFAGCVSDPQKGIRADDFRRHIEYLASDEMRGRNNDTPEGRKAAEYVAAEMKRIGLEPAGTDGYFHAFEIGLSSRGRTHKGINVVGRLPGSHPDLKNEIIVINAHHDARGVIRDKVQNGADDNASGVAMILELAEAFMSIRSKIHRTLVFVSFDAEEDGLLGSRAFVNEDVIGNSKVVADICYDLIGGDFFTWESNRIYGLGSESSPELEKLLNECIAESKDLEVAQISIAVIEPFPGAARSDYANFRRKGIPFVFFSTATPWYYHTPWDDLDIINWEKLEKAGRFCFRFIRELANMESRPKARKVDPKISVDDLRFMRTSLMNFEEAGEEIKLTDRMKKDAKKLVAALDKHIEAGATGRGAVRTVNQAMILLFRASSRQNPHRK